MKNLKISVLVVSASLAIQAQAAFYDISFSGPNITATGQVDVNGSDIATSGFLDVTFNGTTIDYTQLAPVGVTVTTTGGGDFFGQDNSFNPHSATQGGFLTQNGLVFYNGTSYANQSGGAMALSNDGSTPNLEGLGNVGGGGFGYTVPNVDGTLTVTAVPEASTMFAGASLLLPFAASALRIKRKNKTA